MKTLRGTLLTAVALLAFAYGTRQGRTLREMIARSWVAHVTGRQLTLETRRGLLLDDTYPILVEINRRTPPDAVILFPPREILRGEREFIPVAASASSAYSFIYPRVPVHYGEGAPYRDRVTHVLNYDHWALETFWPQVPLTEENRHGVLPWPGGRRIP